MKGPMFGTIWWLVSFIVFAAVAGAADTNAIYLRIGPRSMIALVGYLIMQVGLWRAEHKWDEEGSAAWLNTAEGDKGSAPEDLEERFSTESKSDKVDEEVAVADAADPIKAVEGRMMVAIPETELKAAFPVPWGFLIGWWVWGISYIFPIDGSINVDPTAFGIVALVVCFFVGFIASIPMSDAVMHRLGQKKKMLSLMFLLGWIILGVMSALDATKQMPTAPKAPVWILCMFGPITIVISQKILFGSRKMGTLWEKSGAPNFHPIVYNMGGPLFVWGWFFFWLGTSGVPVIVLENFIYLEFGTPYIPLFLNARTLLAFLGGCGMVSVVRFLDYSHDEDGAWCGKNDEGKVFKKWWLGTDGTYFGLFLESPFPFIIFWTTFGFACLLTWDNSISAGAREIIILVNCIAQGVTAGILIQQNLYAGNAHGKKKFSLPFLLLFIALAINIGSRWNWRALALSLPGAILVVLGQKTVFGDRKRGDYTMQNDGKANPYDKVLVYSWGEVFFMMGWILVCWGQSLPE